MDLPLLASALLIFCLRITDVSIGTLRITFLVRGKRTVAGMLSFFESLIWLLAAAQVLSTLDSPLKFVAYAGGYATGTMLGVSVERWIAVGDVLMRIITPVDAPSAEHVLRQAGYGVTVVNGQGMRGDVRILFVVLPRRRTEIVMRLVKGVNPDAYITFEPTSQVRATFAAPTQLRK
jgi:uncharacterized protein YebE (UPF0316 family)